MNMFLSFSPGNKILVLIHILSVLIQLLSLSMVAVFVRASLRRPGNDKDKHSRSGDWECF